MKHSILTVVLLFSVIGAQAQVSPDPGPGPQSLIDLAVGKAKEMKIGGSLGMDGRVGTVNYLAIYSLHDASGRDFMEFVNVGWEARKNEKVAGFVMPLTIDPTYLTHKILSTPWAQKYITASKFPPIFFGIGPVIPLDWQQARAWKPLDPGAWRATASVRLGSLIK